MNNYISREAAKLLIFEYGIRHRDNVSIASTCENLERQINHIPSADVRTVVLCKNCRMSNVCSDEREMYCTLFFRHMPVNHFCSFGEEKSNENLN